MSSDDVVTGQTLQVEVNQEQPATLLLKAPRSNELKYHLIAKEGERRGEGRERSDAILSISFYQMMKERIKDGRYVTQKEEEHIFRGEFGYLRYQFCLPKPPKSPCSGLTLLPRVL